MFMGINFVFSKLNDLSIYYFTIFGTVKFKVFVQVFKLHLTLTNASDHSIIQCDYT